MERLKPRTIRLIGRVHAWVWRLTRGRLVNGIGAAPFILLTTKGRKTERARTTPVLYLEDGGDLIVVGSRGLHGLRALGSVSERVAHGADATVLVAR